MVKRVIVWTSTAKLELKLIFDFFNLRNNSKTYSLKLHRKIQTELNLLILQPFLGKKTDIISVRGFIVENYILFYELKEDKIIILSVRNTRQNPDKVKF
jgi:toxin YoeB